VRRRRESLGRPLWRQVIAQWPDEYRYDFEERAAIKEFLDNRPREIAEREAYEEVSRKYLAYQQRAARRG
jgi:hypothetical protein